MPERDIDEISALIETLLGVWQHAIQREDALRLILNDCCPDWKHHYQRYFDDPSTSDHALTVVEPLRKVSEAILRGDCDHALLDRVRLAIEKKPN